MTDQPVGRYDALSAARACAVLLLLASQVFLVHPWTDLDQVRPLDALVRAGTLSVAALFAASGFAMTRAVLGAAARGRRASALAGVRVLVLGVPAVALAAVGVIVMRAVDDTDTYSWDATLRSALHAVLFDQNRFALDHPFTARVDLLGTWVLAVEAQLLLALLVVLVVVGAHPRVLAALALLGAAGATVWNLHVFDSEGWVSATLRSDTHVDAVLLGALCALVVPWLARRPSAASSVAGCMVLLGVLILLGSSDVGLRWPYLGPQAGVALVTGLLLASSAVADGRGRLFDLMDAVPAVRDLGRNWRYAVAVSLPVLYAVARHGTTWGSATRLAVALGIIGAILFVVDQVVRPVLSRGLGRIRRDRVEPPSTGPTESVERTEAEERTS